MSKKNLRLNHIKIKGTDHQAYTGKVVSVDCLS
jgi:hypothetical protein